MSWVCVIPALVFLFHVVINIEVCQWMYYLWFSVLSIKVRMIKVMDEEWIHAIIRYINNFILHCWCLPPTARMLLILCCNIQAKLIVLSKYMLIWFNTRTHNSGQWLYRHNKLISQTPRYKRLTMHQPRSNAFLYVHNTFTKYLLFLLV